MSIIKNNQAAKTTITRDMSDLDREVGNVYETVVVLGKRADQISTQIKEELGSKLEEFATSTENLEEIYENREQIEISKYYEKLPKSTILSLDEFKNGKIYTRRRDEENAE
ncbi:MAG TPA: RNA polymerase Rpb6 [Bacteroidetes bacterium]|nr:RNA polymerase Rpb6 [Bacteroidota bacterium]